jgi:hypothetical protein
MSVMDPTAPYTVTEIELDVTEAVGVGERCAIGCSLFVPRELPERPTVLVAVPGGTYSRKYYDLEPPGMEGYSEARWFAERGIVFAAMDYLSGGESSRPRDGEALTMTVLADAAHAAFVALRAGLEGGQFDASPLAGATYVGMGWSFGGCLTIVHQGTHSDYDAVVVRGWSPLALDAHGGYDLPDDWDDLSPAARRDVILACNVAVIGSELPVYHGNPRGGPMRDLYYTPDVDERLPAYDMQHLHTLVSRSAGVDVMTPGFAQAYAERISCPLLLAFADRDVVATPRGEGRGYPGSRHITTVVIPRMAHVHNFADTRAELWRDILVWLGGVSRSQPE